MRDLGLRLVKYLRAAARGELTIKGTEDWAPEEYDKVADLILEDMREGNWEEIEKLYRVVGPFPERYIGPEPEVYLQ